MKPHRWMMMLFAGMLAMCLVPAVSAESVRGYALYGENVLLVETFKDYASELTCYALSDHDLRPAWDWREDDFAILSLIPLPGVDRIALVGPKQLVLLDGSGRAVSSEDHNLPVKRAPVILSPHKKAALLLLPYDEGLLTVTAQGFVWSARESIQQNGKPVKHPLIEQLSLDEQGRISISDDGGQSPMEGLGLDESYMLSENGQYGFSQAYWGDDQPGCNVWSRQGGAKPVPPALIPQSNDPSNHSYIVTNDGGVIFYGNPAGEAGAPRFWRLDIERVTCEPLVVQENLY